MSAHQDRLDALEAQLRDLGEEVTRALERPGPSLKPPRPPSRRGTREVVRNQLLRAAASRNPLIRRGAGGVLVVVRGVRAGAPSLPRPRLPLSREQAAPADDVVERLRRRNAVTVVVPVHNAPEDLERCLRSVIEHTNVPHELLVIDDASTDPRVAPLLDAVAAFPHVRVVRLPVNRGFTATVNHAIRTTGEDLVLLNSDTLVPPGWLQGLILAVHQGERIATATPLSDNAGAFSAPVPEQPNPRPEGLDPAVTGRLVRQSSARLYPRIPTGSGYCLYLRRRALEEVGELDEQAFPRGYGEENDFCMRAASAGWEHVLDDATYVAHRRSASFGPERTALRTAGRAKLDELHPTYTRQVRAFQRDEQVRRAREQVGRAFARARRGARPRVRVLFVLHQGSGGTPATNLDLMAALEPEVDGFTLTAGARTLELRRLVDGSLELVRRWELAQPWSVTDLARADYRTALATILADGAFELVHIRHLLGHSLELPSICKALGIPVVLSFHDFYLSCPTVHLLDEQDRFCGGRCTPGPGTCRLSTRRMKDVPPLKHHWVHEWRLRVGDALDATDLFVTTSQSAKSVMERSFPALKQRPFVIIPHGRDLPRRTGVARAPRDGETTRVLFTGNIGAHKGAHLIRRLADLDRGERLDLHFLGRTAPELFDVGTHHGEYDRDDLADRVAAVAPAFIGILSIWAETYCHTLTEAWAAGVPVLASDIGVLRERVLASGAGWLIDHRDAATAYRQILAAAADPAEYDRRRAAAERVRSRSTTDMAADYARLYTSLLRPRAWTGIAGADR
jgi:GT2 family glycosyltransferase